jgi:ATP-dependent DNA helicase RecG
MTQHELDTIILSGEGYKTEFKRNVNTDLSKELAAFANSSGGKGFLGIEDNGAINGVTIDNALKSKVTMMAHECDPSVDIELEACNNVLIVNVPEGKNKPYRCTNGFYIRNGASSIKLTTLQIIDFIQSEGKVRFNELINKSVKYPEQLNGSSITRFKQLSGITASITNDALLTNLGLVYHNEKTPAINNTGVLFFGKDPAQYIPQSVVTGVVFKGNSKVDILDRKSFDLDIITNIDDAITFLKRHLNVSYEIKEKQRKEKLEIPEVVLREAVVNAVAHRDYFEKGANVMIEIFDDRVEISNPGGLPKGFKPEDFGKRTLARNPLIAALLNRARYIEKLGTGIQRMRQEMAGAGLPEPDFSFDGFFTIVLKRLLVTEKAIALSLNVSTNRLERMMYLLKELQTGDQLNISNVAIRFNIAENAVRKDLLLLVAKGWVIASGSTSNRQYKLSQQANEQFSV